MQNLSEITTLEGLRAFIEAFEDCPLKAGAKQAVFSDGDPSADIMLIGEAPGAREDELGKPFVGRSGQLLDKMLEATGLSREGKDGLAPVYISNVMFWRPPENRNPTPAELASVRPLVDKHIELVNPKLVVLVGGVPTKEMLRTTSGIMKLRGKWQDLNVNGKTFPALPLFHPAFLLRNPPAKKEAWTDLQELRRRGLEMGLTFGPLADIPQTTKKAA